MANSADPDQLATDLDLHCRSSAYPGSAGQGLSILVPEKIHKPVIFV